MPVYSMTGYASAQHSTVATASEADPKSTAAGQLGLEIRSVNSRFLDLSFRLPEDLRQFEPPLRELIVAKLKRGKVEVRAFIDDMAAMYGWADLVICRAGALTVSELAAVGVPALFVPFPAAVDDHQTHNAQFLVNAGAAVLIQERDLSGDKGAQRLADALHNLFVQGRAHLLHMAERARERAIVDADVRIADECSRLAAGDAA